MSDFTIHNFANIALFICTLILIGATAYNDTTKTLKEKAEYFIAEVAKLEIPGELKMEKVLNQLQAHVPIVFKPFFTKAKLLVIAQATYDVLKEFAKNDLK